VCRRDDWDNSLHMQNRLVKNEEMCLADKKKSETHIIGSKKGSYWTLAKAS